MRKLSVCLVIAATLLLAGAFALHGPVAAATTGGSQTPTLRFDVKFSPFNLIDVGKPNLSDGDEIVFHDQLFSHGRKVGDELGSCVIVDEVAVLGNCTMVIRLAQGDISAQFANSPPPRKSLALTGGTGAYRTVDGEGTLVEAGNGTGTLTLHLFG
jgi:hypothetical protein